MSTSATQADLEKRLLSPLEDLVKKTHPRQKRTGKPKKGAASKGKKPKDRKPAKPDAPSVRPSDVRVTIRNEYAASQTSKPSSSHQRRSVLNNRSREGRYFDHDRMPARTHSGDVGIDYGQPVPRRQPLRPPPSRLPKIRKP
jgi:hypothetical protein